MTFSPRGSEQKRIVETVAPLSVVLGGAGTGKTTCALAAARAHIERPTTRSRDRVLFLSFSRASVGRIAASCNGILGSHTSRVDVSTFHALAYSIVRKFGSVIGRPDAVLVSPPREKLSPDPDNIGYGILLPLALQILSASPAVREHFRSRWGLILVDEFQDTGDRQQALLDEIKPNARVILLGDPNQCIYTFLAADGVRLERINEACANATADNTIELPDTSHRDPTGVIPSVARAVLHRDFGSVAIAKAIDERRLEVHSQIELDDEVGVVAATVKELQDDGLGVAVFTHHNDMLAALSDGLEEQGINHEIAGLNDALACALDAQVAMIRFASNDVEWTHVLDALAVFVTSAQRGPRIPRLAQQIFDGTGASTLQQRLSDLRTRLESTSSTDIACDLEIAAHAHQTIGLPSKSNAWSQATSLLRTMRARAVRQVGRTGAKLLVVHRIAAAAREATYSVLTDMAVDPQDVQLMNLYQTKGREADATVVVFREGDFMGTEDEPFPTTSRLLYVVFSRARQRIVVLLVGDTLHPAVAPFAELA